MPLQGDLLIQLQDVALGHREVALCLLTLHFGIQASVNSLFD